MKLIRDPLNAMDGSIQVTYPSGVSCLAWTQGPMQCKKRSQEQLNQMTVFVSVHPVNEWVAIQVQQQSQVEVDDAEMEVEEEEMNSFGIVKEQDKFLMREWQVWAEGLVRPMIQTKSYPRTLLDCHVQLMHISTHDYLNWWSASWNTLMMSLLQHGSVMLHYRIWTVVEQEQVIALSMPQKQIVGWYSGMSLTPKPIHTELYERVCTSVEAFEESYLHSISVSVKDE